MNSDWEKWPFYGSLSLLPSPRPLTTPWPAPCSPLAARVWARVRLPTHPCPAARQTARALCTHDPHPGGLGTAEGKVSLALLRTVAHLHVYTHRTWGRTWEQSHEEETCSPGCKTSAPRPLAPQPPDFPLNSASVGQTTLCPAVCSIRPPPNMH